MERRSDSAWWCVLFFVALLLAVLSKHETVEADKNMQVIRGNSVVMLEALERIGGDDRPPR